MSIVHLQLDELRREFPGAAVEERTDGSAVITVPDVPLPLGWSHPRTTVQFVVPVGFPMAQPDCFWVEPELRLASGSLPKNAALQAPPFGNTQRLWFSWHVAGWNAGRDSLKSYLRVVMNRLAKPE